jgi:hypothetical protein
MKTMADVKRQWLADEPVSDISALALALSMFLHSRHFLEQPMKAHYHRFE